MLIQELANTNYPFVVSGRVQGVDSDTPVYSVNTDNKQGSFQCVSHLIGLGHKKIAILNGPLEYIVNLDRYDGYRRALVTNDIQYDPSLEINGGYTFEDAKEAVKKALTEHPEITAIYAKDDMKAVATIKGINEMGLRVPEDIAVVGYNNYDIAEISSPKLTTLDVPIYELGKASGRMLINLIEGNPIESNPEILDANLIVRESCGSHLSK
jgi:LacI family repressor for deo operon, udp, cdd, tsx, nupC, and nupG